MADLNGLLTPEALQTALDNPEHLKQWLEASGRRWLVLPTRDLVDALSWPHGVAALMQIIAAWRDHRRAIPSGDSETLADSAAGTKRIVPVMKNERLDSAELDRVIRHLVGLVTELDPGWSLEGVPQ